MHCMSVKGNRGKEVDWALIHFLHTDCVGGKIKKKKKLFFEEQTFYTPFNQRSLQAERLTVWFFKHGALKKCPKIQSGRISGMQVILDPP